MGTIYYFTPFALDGNLGAAYNQYMQLLPNDDDWACFVDGDAMFMTPDFGKVIADVVEKNPETGMFTCYTNRVANKEQLYRGIFSESADMLHHRDIAFVCRSVMADKTEELTRPISGVMMLIQKRTWKEFPFKDGLLSVDNDISRRLMQAGRKVLLMRGIYLLHYYRMREGRRNTKHLEV